MYMLIEVFVELTAFLTILVVFLVAFGTSLCVYKNEEDMDFTHVAASIGNKWLLMFGEFGDDPDFKLGGVGVFLFFMATTILPMILLNLVIAIMSDTYEKVVTNKDDSDNHQLNTMILQFENMLFWKRKYGTPQHLFWFNYSCARTDIWVS